MSMPSLFVPHGAPTFATDPGPAGEALVSLARALPRPRAIAIASPHWDSAAPRIGCADRLETIHDFWGFPEELYALRYPALGSPEVAEAILSAIRAAGLPVERDGERGLDHGAWVPLRLMYPGAEVPVVPLALQSRGGPERAFRLGQALAPLAAKGILIVGSGSITHNLGDFARIWRSGGCPPDYVREFADWIAERISASDIEALLDYRRQAPSATRAHPTEEHLLPLFFALGAGGEGAAATRFYAGIADAVIAMDGYAFAPPAQ